MTTHRLLVPAVLTLLGLIACRNNETGGDGDDRPSPDQDIVREIQQDAAFDLVLPGVLPKGTDPALTAGFESASSVMLYFNALHRDLPEEEEVSMQIHETTDAIEPGAGAPESIDGRSVVVERVDRELATQMNFFWRQGEVNVLVGFDWSISDSGLTPAMEDIAITVVRSMMSSTSRGGSRPGA